MRAERTSPPRRRPSTADVLTAAMLVAAAVVWTDPGGLSHATLVGLTAVLVTWPAGVIARAGWRWARQGDWRYVGAAALLLAVAITSIIVGAHLVG